MNEETAELLTELLNAYQRAMVAMLQDGHVTGAVYLYCQPHEPTGTVRGFAAITDCDEALPILMRHYQALPDAVLRKTQEAVNHAVSNRGMAPMLPVKIVYN